MMVINKEAGLPQPSGSMVLEFLVSQTVKNVFVVYKSVSL